MSLEQTIAENILPMLLARVKEELGNPSPQPTNTLIDEEFIVSLLNSKGYLTKDNYNTCIHELKAAFDKTIEKVEIHFTGMEKVLFSKLDEEIRELKSRTPRETIIKVATPSNPEGIVVKGGQHEYFAHLLKLIGARVPTYIHGPTGSGKTTAIYSAGQAMNLQVYRKVLSRETGQHELFGYNDAMGKYVEGICYKPFTEGGIILFDEVDNGNPNTNVAIKMLQDTDECWFPCGVKQKHPEFRIVANANTIGNGANSQYVGRNQQDKAFLNIFSFLQWDYDEAFEYSICWREYVAYGGEDKNKFDSLVHSFRQVRRAIVDLQINHILSPRNLKDASRMLALNFENNIIAETIVFRGMDAGQREKIEGKVKGAAKKDGLRRMDNLW
jgi:hypothetical protein